MSTLVAALGIWTFILGTFLVTLPSRRMQFAEVFSASLLLLVLCAGYSSLQPKRPQDHAVTVAANLAE